MPTAVLMMIGQIEVMKITKIAEGWLSRNAASDDRQPGQRRHRAQHLEDRVEPAHRPDRLADERAEQDADDRREAEADGHALQRDQHPPAEPDVLRAEIEERRRRSGRAPRVQITDGAGSVAPGLSHRICQSRRSSAPAQRRRDARCGASVRRRPSAALCRRASFDRGCGAG